MKFLFAILIFMTGIRAYSCNLTEASQVAQTQINSLVKDEGGSSYFLGPFGRDGNVAVAVFSFKKANAEVTIGYLIIDMQTCDWTSGGHSPIGPSVPVK